MGNSISDNQEVTYTSGLQRLCNGIVCAICVAPVLLIASVFLLGWNEQRAVCEAKAIAQGADEVVQVGCSSSSEGNGQLVMFSCDVSQAGLTPLSEPGSDFSSISYIGTGLSVTSEMYQCVEHESSSTTKDSTGGGTTTVKTYSYSREWKSYSVNSAEFKKRDSSEYWDNCDVSNPSWPAGVPESGARYADSVDVGAFTVEGEFVSMVPLTTPVTSFTAPSGWSSNGEQYESNKWEQGSRGIGQVRVSFKGTDWAKPTVTVLGENNGGVVSRWTASDSWLCSGSSLAKLRSGIVDKDALFTEMKAESNAVTYVLRILGFLAIWFAFGRFLAPLGVAADCVPCVGPCLGDAVESIACCVTCPAASGCALGVIGVVWVVMRPEVGIPLMVIFLLTCGGSIGFLVYSKMKNKSGDAREITENPKEEA